PPEQPPSPTQLHRSLPSPALPREVRQPCDGPSPTEAAEAPWTISNLLITPCLHRPWRVPTRNCATPALSRWPPPHLWSAPERGALFRAVEISPTPPCLIQPLLP